jgi:hypothetical protein
MTRLARAAMGGLLSGLLIASVALGVSAVSRLGARCVSHSENECALEREIAGEGARGEGLLALGALLCSGGLFLRLRR